MINKPNPFKGLNIRIPSRSPLRGGGVKSGVWASLGRVSCAGLEVFQGFES